MEVDSKSLRKLLIISATPVQIVNGEARVFEPTLREIESLIPFFDRILWFAYPMTKTAGGLFRPPVIKNIDIRLLPGVHGGPRLIDKLAMIPRLFGMIGLLYHNMRRFQYIHTRGPSVPALLAIILSFVLTRKKYWHKYAGNWGQQMPPLAFGIQRWLLKHSNQTVTVNGSWSNQNSNVISFDNPCFTELELAAARQVTRSFKNHPLRILFVGRMEERKGIFVLLEAAGVLQGPDYEFVLVGPGYDDDKFLRKLKTLKNVSYRGELSRVELNIEYQSSHFLVLPSFSEGFPKVVSEACGFGCIPIVTNVSAIEQHITPDVGFLLERPNVQNLVDCLLRVRESNLAEMSRNAQLLAERFTYERFAMRISTEVFK
ncbi:MAG: glycosyltransferase family 4 protein [Cyclobacteriaceae bacterium]|nr:glycosyltransferase family 4 protein [Cyclobacteriaceae bacterium]